MSITLIAESDKMVKTKTLGIVLSCIVFLLVANSAFATVWQLNFNGQLTDITEYLGDLSSDNIGDYNFHQNRFNIGQSFSGSFLIDDTAPELIKLADGVRIAAFTIILSHKRDICNHYKKGMEAIEIPKKYEEVVLEKNVQIGIRSIIMPGVKIGKGVTCVISSC